MGLCTQLRNLVAPVLTVKNSLEPCLTSLDLNGWDPDNIQTRACRFHGIHTVHVRLPMPPVGTKRQCYPGYCGILYSCLLVWGCFIPYLCKLQKTAEDSTYSFLPTGSDSHAKSYVNDGCPQNKKCLLWSKLLLTFVREKALVWQSALTTTVHQKSLNRSTALWHVKSYISIEMSFQLREPWRYSGVWRQTCLSW